MDLHKLKLVASSAPLLAERTALWREKRVEEARAGSRWWITLGSASLRLAFFAVAIVAIRHQVATLHVADLAPILRSYGWPQLVAALGCAVLSFLTLGAIEWSALATVAPHVPRRTAWVTAFIAHAFSQSVGVAMLTGAGVRLRAYAHHGMNGIGVARVTAVVTAAVSLGLLTLGSIVLILTPSLALSGIHIPARPAALLMASIVLSYLVWSVIAPASNTRAASAWPHHPPPLGTAAAQIVLSVCDWCLTATVLFALLPSTSVFPFVSFMGAYVVAQTAAMLSHVPGGVGVFDATLFGLLASLGDLDSRTALAAALLAYRVVYYLLPLGAATMVAAVIEGRRSRSRVQTTDSRRAETSESAGSTCVQDADCLPDWLIDNADGYDRLILAIGSASRSVWMTQLAFDADCVAHRRTAGADETHLAEAVLSAVARAPVDVRIILNASLLLDTARPLRRFFTERLAALGNVSGAIQVRGVSCFPRLLHSKMVIVDGREAFLFGSPFVNGYWDDERHEPVDPRRPSRELGGRPLHDVSLRIEGRSVAALEGLFSELWNDVAVDVSDERPGADDGTALKAALKGCATDPMWFPPVAGTAGTAVRVVSTSSRGVIPGRPAGSTEIKDALLGGIAGARSLIYVEHQYLSARPVVAALTEALERESDLELIVVLNQNPDVTAYRRWQNARLGESGLLAHPRAGVFALWSAAPARSGRATIVNQVFVHSKVVAIDDEWATVGSANLDGASLHSYGDDFAGIVGRRVFRHVRNFDVNLVVDARGPGSARPRTVGDLRTRLWSEHLQLPAASLATRPAGGWLPMWRARAAANVASLGAPAPQMRGFVLPYSTRSTPVDQLADLGVRIDPARLDVRFNPGWLEVRFSPNWVRNMFS